MVEGESELLREERRSMYSVRPYIGKSLSTKRTDETIQANQASKPSIEHAIHTIQHRSGRADNQRTKQKQTSKHEQDQTKTKRKPNVSQRKPDENQTETKQQPKPNE
jgi:hypothetical protein